MKYSIITSIYNSRKYLEGYFENLKALKYSDFEVVIIDDCSTEDYQKIIDSYKGKLDVKYTKLQNNVGPGSARNIGLKIATGEFVVFMDVDDYIDSNIFNILDNNESYKYDIVVFDYYTFCNGRLHRQESVINSKYEIENTNDLSKRIINSVWGKLFKKTLIEQNLMEFPELYKAEDLVFLIRYLNKCETFLYLRKYLYTYLINNNSLMHTNLESQLENSQKALELLKCELRDKPDIYQVILLREKIYDSINVLVRLGKNDSELNEFYASCKNEIEWSVIRDRHYFTKVQIIVLYCIKNRYHKLIRLINWLR